MRLELIEPGLERQHRFAPQAEDAQARIAGHTLVCDEARPERMIVKLCGPLIRSVLEPVPMYCNVPPFSTRFAAAELEAPSVLAEPPFVSVGSRVVPPLIIVAPV